MKKGMKEGNGKKLESIFVRVTCNEAAAEESLVLLANDASTIEEQPREIHRKRCGKNEGKTRFSCNDT